MFKLVYSLLLLSLAGAAPTALLPVNNAVPGWNSITESNCVSGTANNSTELYRLIDGGAEVYLTRGFAGCALASYSNGVDTICVAIYDQSFQDSALSLFRYYDFGEYEPLSSLGDTAKMDSSPAFSNMIELVTGKYFVRIDIQNKSRSLISTGRAFATNIITSVIAVERSSLSANVTPTIQVLPMASNKAHLIRVAGASEESITVKIVNCTGAKVGEVVLTKNGSVLEGIWNSRNSQGKKAAAATYIAQVQVKQKFLSAAFSGF